MCSKVFGGSSSHLALSVGLSNTDNIVTSLSKDLQNIFPKGIDDYFITQENGIFSNKNALFPKERCIKVLNEIASTKSGYYILNALKTELDKIKPLKKIIFIQKQSEHNPYGFVSENALSLPDANYLTVKVASEFISDQRYIFDGNRVETHTFLADKKSEAYFIAHELTHVVSFLNSGVTNETDWKLRKGEVKEMDEKATKIKQDAGWVNFFNETEQMKKVYHGLLLDGFTPKQIIDTFRSFFLNTEEARNVLGLVKVNIDGQETFIGEGEMFKERNPSKEGIVTYLTKTRQINMMEQAVLKRLTDDRYLARGSPNSRDAVMVLGSQFAGFDLVNSDENNIESVLRKTPIDVTKTSFDNFYNVVNEHVAYCKKTYSSFCTPYTESTIRFQIELENLNALAKDIQKPIVLIRSDDKNPQNFTFKKFYIDGREELCTDTFSKIRKDNPDAVFIYYNGVNHVQALVPQQPVQQAQN